MMSTFRMMMASFIVLVLTYKLNLLKLNSIPPAIIVKDMIESFQLTDQNEEFMHCISLSTQDVNSSTSMHDIV